MKLVVKESTLKTIGDAWNDAVEQDDDEDDCEYPNWEDLTDEQRRSIVTNYIDTAFDELSFEGNYFMSCDGPSSFL
jgi:hypothetical protein